MQIFFWGWKLQIFLPRVKLVLGSLSILNASVCYSLVVLIERMKLIIDDWVSLSLSYPAIPISAYLQQLYSKTLLFIW